MLENSVGEAALLCECSGGPMSNLSHIPNFHIKLVLWWRDKHKRPRLMLTCWLSARLYRHLASSLALLWRITGSAFGLRLPWISAAQVSWEVPYVWSRVLNRPSDSCFLTSLTLYNHIGIMCLNLDCAAASRSHHGFVIDSPQDFPSKSWAGCWSSRSTGVCL